MKKSVIFDLDGTLLNTLEDLANAGNHLLALHGFPTHAAEAYKYFVGDGILKLVERMVPEALRGDAAWLEGMRDEFNVYYALHKEDLTAPYPGILELLEQLTARGIPLAVLTNKPEPFARALCEKMFGDRFALVCGQREGRPAKPDRRLVEELLRTTGFSAAQTLYVGDSGVDMQTAKNGGLYAAGALWGFRTAAELVENGADTLVEAPAGVLELLD